MYRQLLEKSPLLALPLLSLVLFLVCFVAIVARTYMRRSDAYAKTAGLPLEDDRKGDDHV
jgi:cbb3-type cytochrome oxidase subunit 3